MTFDVRRLSHGDAAIFYKIRLEALRTHPDAYGSGTADWEHRSLAEIARFLENGNVFGLFDRGALAGIASLVPESGAHQRHVGMVYSVYLSGEVRGMGAFDILMDEIENCARELGLLQLVLHAGHHNTRAISAYKRAGYSITGTIPRALCVNGAFFDEAVMVKALDA